MKIRLTFSRITVVLGAGYLASRSLDIIQMVQAHDYWGAAILLGVIVAMAPIMGWAVIYLLRRLKPDLLE